MGAARALFFLLVCAGAAGAFAAEDAAPRSLANCDAAVRARPASHDAWSCYLRLAHGWRRGRTPVIRHLEGLAARSPRDLFARLWLGILAHDDSEGARAEAALRPAAEEFRARGEAAGEVLARAELAVLLCYEGRAADAAPEVARLDAVAAPGGDPELRANALFAEAVCARKAHDHAAAIGLSEKARALLSPLPGSFRRRRLLQQVLDGLGSAYSDTGRHREACEVFRQLASMDLSDPFAEAIVRHRLASQSIWLADEGELAWDDADLRIRQSLEMERRLPAPHWGPYATRILHAARRGPSREAVAELDEAIAFWRPRAAWGVLTAQRIRAKYTIDLDPGARAAALEHAEESLALARTMGNRWNVAMALLARAYVHRRSGARAFAIEDGLAALGELDALRDQQTGEMVRAWTSSESSFAYPLVAGWLLEGAGGAPAARDLELAFASIERHRARVLLESVAAFSPRERAPPSVPTLDRIQGALGPRQALLSFHVWKRQHTQDAPYDDGSSWVLAVTRQSVRAARIPDADDLRARVLLLRSVLERRDASAAEGAAALYRDLLAEAIGSLPPEVDELILVPDGPLHLLPFSLLRPAADAAPLASRYPVSVVPSAAMWLRWRSQPPDVPAAAPEALVFADPAAATAGPALRIASLGGAPEERAGPRPLPFAAAEAGAIAEALGPGTRVLSGTEASERALKGADLRPLQIVHFAAHAIIDGESPERSALVLAPGPGGEDGFLQPAEAARLDLKGKLVVLATCESANGVLLGGEGPLSLARAFFAAGSRAVVASLWRVRDDDAKEIFGSFYEQIGKGVPVGEALARAQRQRMRAGAPAVSWAGLVAFGDGAMAPWPQRPRIPRWIWPVIGGFALAGAAAALRSSSRRRTT